jgi:hypothetical protein
MDLPMLRLRRQVDPIVCAALVAVIAAAACLFLVAMDDGVPGLSWADKDFANYWTAARLALEGKVLEVFGPQPVYFGHMQAFFGPDYPWHAWSYPPHYLLAMLPLGLFPYKAGLVVFLLSTFLLLCAAIRVSFGRTTPWQFMLLLPALATNAVAVQNGFLLSALLLTGLGLREKRPYLAGICFGLLTVKPQLGVLIPLLLLWELNWRSIASAGATMLAAVMLSILVFGVEPWSGYFENVVPYQTLVMNKLQGLFLHMMPTTFGSIRSLGGSAGVAFAVHLPFAVAVLGLYFFSLVRLGRTAGTADARSANTIFATTLAVPYLVNYDLVGLVACAVFASAQKPASLALRCAVIVLAFLPPFMPFLGIAGFPVAPLVVLAAWLLLLHRDLVFAASHRAPPSPQGDGCDRDEQHARGPADEAGGAGAARQRVAAARGGKREPAIDG